jgi:hypothetical protein
MTIGTVTSTTKETRAKRVFSFMPFTVYILYSVVSDQYYTGQAEKIRSLSAKSEDTNPPGRLSIPTIAAVRITIPVPNWESETGILNHPGNFYPV